MDINKIIIEALQESDTNMKQVVQESVKQELENMKSDNETLSETLLSAALPSAISAGIGAVSLRKKLTHSNTLTEVDWEEISKKVGEHYDTAKKAIGTGAQWLAKKAEEGYEGLKKIPGKISNYIADKKAERDADAIAGKVTKRIKNISDKIDDVKAKGKHAGRVASKLLRKIDSATSDDGKKGE